MIKLDKDGITLTGSRIELLTELGCIIHEMYKIGMNGTDEDKTKGILTDLICATLKASTDSIEIISALSKPGLDTDLE